MSERTSGLGRTDVARCWAGFASLGAGLVHVAVTREHLDHWVLAGVFFLVLALAQLAWGVAAMARQRAPFPGAYIALNVAIIALWGLSRTSGLPFGPDTGLPENRGTADTLCMVLQLLIVVALGYTMVTERTSSSARGPATRQLRVWPALAGLGAGALLVSLLTTPALAATEAGKYARSHGSHGSGPHEPRVP